ncbi:MAG TPA: SET domain-containing protein-lysine N-methyltransferase [Gemmatimonadaceae bacterium]|nr:SET domain-containing protein-lysine N-methyltransferase [Gemmatimonadaceae bacterium]
MNRNGTNGRADMPYEIRKSSIQGRGAFATRRLRPGQRIIEYVGDRITNDEADKRYDEEHMSRHHTFLFTLDDDTVIDGDVKENVARFINHSCDPNCEAVIEDEHIWIYALKNIQPGVELAYDYQYERTGENDEELEKFYVCKCGSPKCRGSIMKPEKKRRKKKSNARKGR